MRKRLFFGMLVAILALGLIFIACGNGTTEPGGQEPGETLENLVIPGKIGGKDTITTISANSDFSSSKAVLTPTTGYYYKIEWKTGGIISKGRIQYQPGSTYITFVPDNNSDPFQARYYGGNDVRISATIKGDDGQTYTLVAQPATSSPGGGGSSPTNPPATTAVQFLGVDADGDESNDTSLLMLEFDTAISGLTKNNITLRPQVDAAVITTGEMYALMANANGESIGWLLSVTTSKSTYVEVSVSNFGNYTFSGGPHEVPIYKAGDPLPDLDVEFISVVATNLEGTTTALVLTFDEEINNLGKADITITGVQVTTGNFSGPVATAGKQVYTLEIIGITTPGDATVKVEKAGFAIIPSSKTVTIIKAAGDIDVTFEAVEAIDALGTTESLKLTFDTQIIGLASGNISWTGTASATPKGIPGWSSGTVSGVPVYYYTLLLDVEEAGTATVSVDNRVGNYVIGQASGQNYTVTINKANNGEFMVGGRLPTDENLFVGGNQTLNKGQAPQTISLGLSANAKETLPATTTYQFVVGNAGVGSYSALPNDRNIAYSKVWDTEGSYIVTLVLKVTSEGKDYIYTKAVTVTVQ